MIGVSPGASRPTPVIAAGTPAPAIALHGVAAGYGDRLALEAVDLVVPAGSLLAVVGPNGAGKSTLLKVIAGLLRPSAGTVEVLGASPGAAAQRIAYVPQAEAVDWEFPVTVGEVVMMGRVPRIGLAARSGIGGPGARSLAALDTVRMADAIDRQIGALSGGQRRRVFLARALASEPDLYLLDEPVTGVDATTQEDLMDVLEAETRAGRTVVATTHDLALRGPSLPARRPWSTAGSWRPGRPRTSSSTSTCSPRPTAATSWCCPISAAARSSSMTLTTTTRRLAENAISTRNPGRERRRHS